MTAAAREPIPDRHCDSCTLCCKLLSVPALRKEPGVWCEHCEVGSGCRIYADRPDACRTFACEFLLDATLTEAWRPSTSRLVLVESKPEKLLIAYVDPQRPDVWKKEPYYSKLKAWSKTRAATRENVVVYVGRRVIVIGPENDVDVGHVGPDETIAVTIKPTPSGLRCEASKVRRDATTA